MENMPGTGQRYTPAELATVLRLAADQVEKNASIEGSIAWETPATDFDFRYEVLAFFRTGNDMGQRRCVVIRDFTADQTKNKGERA